MDNLQRSPYDQKLFQNRLAKPPQEQNLFFNQYWRTCRRDGRGNINCFVGLMMN